MRNKVYAAVLSSLVLQAACGDDGSGETTQMPTSVSATPAQGTDSADAGTDSAAVTDTNQPTSGGGMSDSQTSNGPTSETDPTVTSASTSTDPSTTNGPSTSDPSTDPGDTSTTAVDPSDGTTTTGGDDTTTMPVDPGTTTSDDTTTAPMETTEDIPCAVQEATLTPVIPNIMIVLDKSGSMLTLWDHDANPNTATITRWASLHAVVSAVVNAFDLKINFGANLFPSKTATNTYDATACPVQNNVEVPVGPNKGTPIINAIPAANNMTIKGGTPASAGMTAAVNQLKSLDPTIPRAILFITDGAANCGMGLQTPQLFEQYDMNLHTIVEQARTVDNISTYVVGIDIANAVSPNTMDGNPNGINPTEKLNDVAVKGGKPKNDPNEKFYNAANQIELDAALDAIINDAISCEIKLDSEPAKPEFTEVKISGQEIPFVNDCNGNGWTWVNPNGPYDALVLCGTACSQLKMVGKADVNFYCMPG